MVFSTTELIQKYNNYENPNMKIVNETKKNNLIRINRGLYEDNKNTSGYLLCQYLKSPSYLSFEYVLSLYGLIPEMVVAYTCATTGERHTFKYSNHFGTYLYRDVPSRVFRYEVEQKIENGYAYFIASPEKALCDLLYASKPLSSRKQLISFLLDVTETQEKE